jgi:hypothetical protein
MEKEKFAQPHKNSVEILNKSSSFDFSLEYLDTEINKLYDS